MANHWEVCFLIQISFKPKTSFSESHALPVYVLLRCNSLRVQSQKRGNVFRNMKGCLYENVEELTVFFLYQADKFVLFLNCLILCGLNHIQCSGRLCLMDRQRVSRTSITSMIMWSMRHRTEESTCKSSISVLIWAEITALFVTYFSGWFARGLSTVKHSLCILKRPLKSDLW